MLELRLAWRDLRGGLRGFRIFLACLILGVAAIAAIGTLREAVNSGMASEGRRILGGDARVKFTYRSASDEERAYLAQTALAQSEIVDFRSMAVVGEDDRALTQVKGIDAAYPLVGEVVLDPPQPLAQALLPQEGLPSAVMAPVLVERLGLQVGDRFSLGLQEFRLAGRLVTEPDDAQAGFGFGPRILLRTEDLGQSGLLGAGTLYETEIRMILPEGADLDAVQAETEAKFLDNGLRWQDHRRAAPGVERFVERLASFLVLVGLAGLAIGGVGISAAVGTYLAAKTPVIATFMTLGASSGRIFRIYAAQVFGLAVVGIACGLALGGALPLALAPLVAGLLPIDLVLAPSPVALLEAAIYGALTVAIFTIAPLARAARTRPAALYRGGLQGGAARPSWAVMAGIGVLVLALIGAAAAFSGMPSMAVGAALGVLGAAGLLGLAGIGLRKLAGWLSRRPAVRGRAGLRLALSTLAAPRGELSAVLMSLGLGLTVLAAVGQMEANLRRAIANDLPDRAPAFFFVDIQNDQIEGVLAQMNANPAVTRLETAPMMRGVLTRINGAPASEVAPDHWVVRGDRGITYADRLPEGATLTAGQFWPEGYDGPPQVSFARKEAEEIGLKLGDKITVNILSRDIEVEITSLREVDFQTGGIGFVMMLSPNAVRGAPHTHIATIYAGPAAEGAILREIGKAYPNVTAIPVREAAARVTDALGLISAVTAWAAAGTLLIGGLVLLGAAAAGERARAYEAAVLKTLGATRGAILRAFGWRAIFMGAVAGLIAVLCAALAGYVIMEVVMESRYAFEPVSALMVICGGIVAVVLAGLAFALRALQVKPAQILRSQ